MRVKCSPDDTVGDLKKLIAAQTGTDWRKIQLKKWYVVNSCGCLSWVVLTVNRMSRYTTFKDHITLDDYEIHDGMSLEMYQVGPAPIDSACTGRRPSLVLDSARRRAGILLHVLTPVPCNMNAVIACSLLR